MKLEKVLKLGLIAVFAIGLTAGCACDKKKEKDNKEEEQTFNTNEGVISDKELNGLKFTNTSLVSTENSATLVTLVTNQTDADVEVRIFNIRVKDKDGNEIVTLQGYVGGVVPAGESREITSNVDMNLDHATDISYELVK